ncbi:MAG: hypothetical protein WC217_00650 [Candidatus Paceibacterota bacterium]|jgi:hypothetical protein
MALPPSIPTSFVPHTSGSSAQKFRSDFTGAFGVLAYIILGVIFTLALGIFIYGRVLAADKVAKDTALAKAEAAIDPATVEGFVRLRNRLNQSSVLLKKHVAFSTFFTSLQSILPASVRFTSLHISLDASGVSKVEGSGVAKSFNSLAVVSSAFAADGRIKDAIFSKISVNNVNNTVAFGLSAILDPKITVFSPNSTVPSFTLPSTTDASSTTPTL